MLKDNVEGEVDRLNSLAYKARMTHKTARTIVEQERRTKNTCYYHKQTFFFDL